MASFSKHVLGGSTNGKPITLSLTATTSGTIVHTVPTGTTGHDEIWLWAVNTSTAGTEVEVIINFGGASDPNGHVVVDTVVAESGNHLLVPGLSFNGGVTMYAFAGSTGLVNLVGYVNRVAT